MPAAGPRMDIVKPAARAGEDVGDAVGFLATEFDEYAECIIKMLKMHEDARHRMARAARQRSLCFSSDRFEHAWLRQMAPVLQPS